MLLSPSHHHTDIIVVTLGIIGDHGNASHSHMVILKLERSLLDYHHCHLEYINHYLPLTKTQK